MKIAFITNYFNHHQKPLADVFYSILGDKNYYFIETTGVPEFRKKLGYQEMTAPYVIKYCDDTKDEVKEIIQSFDVVIYSNAPLSLLKSRYHDGKMTFCYSERRYKTISRYLMYFIYTYRSIYINKGYLLCASAFSPKDYLLSGMSLNKCFRWGYFTEVKEYNDIDEIINAKDNRIEAPSGVSILWVGRLIGLKHPEAPIVLAKKLKEEGYAFNMKIVGGGELESKIKSLIKSYNLEKNVKMLGSLKPTEVREQMEKSQIFLFTSNRHEGWGAVLNESMNSACAVVASDAIGSVPYLIQHEHNGLVYRSGSNKDLYEKVVFLMNNPEGRRRIQIAAYNTMRDIWCSRTAASNFIKLVEALSNGASTPISDGPCSQAPLVFDHTIV